MFRRFFRPQSVSEYKEKAQAALSRGDTRRALALTAEALERFADDPEAWRTRMGLCGALGETEQALAVSDGYLARWDSAEGWYERGCLEQRAGRLEAAAHAFRRATERDAKHADSYINLGCVLDDAGQHAAALAAYDQAIALGDDAMAWSNRGNSLRALERTDEAIACYERALALGFTDARALLRMALLHAHGASLANRAAHPEDGLGEAREQRRTVGDRTLVARYFTRQHTHPELLDVSVEAMLDFIASRAGTAPGIGDGMTFSFHFPVITLRAQGDELLLCEAAPERRGALVHEVTRSAFELVMIRVLHDRVGVATEPCSRTATVDVEAGAAREARVVLRRRAPQNPDDSGWMLLATSSPVLAPVPWELLLAARPSLARLVTLPVGWSAHLDGDRIVRVLDETERVRMGE